MQIYTGHEAKKHKTFHFIDWRPVASAAIKPQITRRLNHSSTIELKSIKEKICSIDEIECINRSDGIFILQIKLNSEEIIQTVMPIASYICRAIKSCCGHHHLFHSNTTWPKLFDPHPVAIYFDTKYDITSEEFASKFTDDSLLSEIKCIHPTKGEPIDYPALLRLKLNYSDLREKFLRFMDVKFENTANHEKIIGVGIRWLSIAIIFISLCFGALLIPSNDASFFGFIRHVVTSLVSVITRLSSVDKILFSVFIAGTSLLPTVVLFYQNRKIIEKRVRMLENAIGFFSYVPILFAVVCNVWKQKKYGIDTVNNNSNHTEPFKIDEPLKVILDVEKWRWQKNYQYSILLTGLAAAFSAVISLILTTTSIK